MSASNYAGSGYSRPGERFIFAVRTEKTRTLEFLHVLHLARDGAKTTRETQSVGTADQNKQLSRIRPNAAEARPEGCRVRWTPLRGFAMAIFLLNLRILALHRVNRVPRRAFDSPALDSS